MENATAIFIRLRGYPLYYQGAADWTSDIRKALRIPLAALPLYLASLENFGVESLKIISSDAVQAGPR